jgi:hypothetical protein
MHVIHIKLMAKLITTCYYLLQAVCVQETRHISEPLLTTLLNLNHYCVQRLFSVLRVVYRYTRFGFVCCAALLVEAVAGTSRTAALTQNLSRLGCLCLRLLW